MPVCIELRRPVPLHQDDVLILAQRAGHDIDALIDQITAASMDRARSISSVLHHRLQHIAMHQLAGHDVTRAQRTPAN
jgi:hypothetical protein